MRRLVAALLAAVLLTVTATEPATAHGNLVDATNDYRLAHGRRALKTNDNLDDIAHIRARQIARDFRHDFWWWGETNCERIGENIAYHNPALGWPERIDWFVEAWAGSPLHDELMLSRRWWRMGAAIYVSPDGAMWGVQIYCEPRW